MLFHIFPYLLLQLIIINTYFILLYCPQIEVLSFKGILVKLITEGNRILFGEEAMRIVEEEEQNRD